MELAIVNLCVLFGALAPGMVLKVGNTLIAWETMVDSEKCESSALTKASGLRFILAPLLLTGPALQLQPIQACCPVVRLENQYF